MTDQFKLTDIPEKWFFTGKPTKEEQMIAQRIWGEFLGILQCDYRKFPIRVNFNEPVYSYDEDGNHRSIITYNEQSKKVIEILQEKIQYEMHRNTGYVLKLNFDTKQLECDVNPSFK
jgi:hypothetical protein